MKRVLCIDGGGIKGVFPAAFLATLEAELGEPIYTYFDYVVGTSTGGLIALGLSLGHSATHILSFYENEAPRIFGGNRALLSLRRLGQAKYDSGPLTEALLPLLGSQLLSAAQVPVMVPAVNLHNGEVHLFSSYGPRASAYMLDAALATSAAPTYFPVHEVQQESLADGGLAAGNPVALALSEAIGPLGWQLSDLRVLSLGCTFSSLDLKLDGSWSSGLMRWAAHIADLYSAGQSDVAVRVASSLLGPERFLRISREVPRGRFRLDDIKAIPVLKGLGQIAAGQQLGEVRRLLGV